eukprot:EC849011.1.p2 GENE.EC849011.1~~EC849011.1.p2  ORF type:complete len:59 (-),score=9.69 EC849011.1:69-245(-)
MQKIRIVVVVVVAWVTDQSRLMLFVFFFLMTAGAIEQSEGLHEGCLRKKETQSKHTHV